MLGRPFERRRAIWHVSACWLACVRSLNSRHLRYGLYSIGGGEASNRPEFIHEYRLVNSNTSNGRCEVYFHIQRRLCDLEASLMLGIFIAPVVKAPAELLFDPFIYGPRSNATCRLVFLGTKLLITFKIVLPLFSGF